MRTRRWMLGVGLTGLLVLFGGFAVGRWTRMRSVAISAPVNEPVRIAVLGDFHITDEASMQHARDCLQRAMAENPDIILLVGDYVHTHHGLPYLKRALLGVHAPLGVYAVLGNHDHWSGKDAVIRALGDSGVRVLREENLTVRKGETKLTLVGIYDLWFRKPDWAKAFRGLPEKPRHPVILLSHNPDAVLSPYRNRTTLIVAGHTHAGQVWMPATAHRTMQKLFGRSYIPKTKYGTSHPYGLYLEGDTWIYITSGVTHGRSVPRWYTRPELSVIELLPQ
ncbi:MAG: metallophosphoesterase [Fimbriimonadales bacterium]|nr:metallophosphoesterase [Fimbriimonadales bacterium]